MSKQRNPNGRGTYYKKNAGFEWRQKKDGQTRYLAAPTLQELELKVRQYADLPIIKEKYKTSEWFEKWLDIYVKPLKKPATYNQYLYIFKSHVLPMIGNRLIRNIKPIDIQSVISKMNEKGLSSWTMIHARKVMSLAFAKAAFEQVISSSPVKSIEIPVKQRKVRKALNAQELAAMFRVLSNSRWEWSVRLLLVTGLRRGELLALKWSDIDYTNNKIIISKSSGESGVGDTKSAKIHYVPLSEIAVDYLKSQKQMLEREFNPSLYRPDLIKADLIFPNQKGELMDPKTYTRTISLYGKRAGVKLSPHCYRHTFVYLTRKNIDLKDLQAILGHEESTTTLDIYGDMINENNKETAGKIDEVFAAVNKDMKLLKVLK